MTTSPVKAPWHLWLVGIVALLWNGFGTFDCVATATRFAPYVSQFPQAMLDYLNTLPGWMWVVWFVGTFGGLIGSILLLMRKKVAIWAFAASLLGAAVSAGTNIISPPPEAAGANLPLALFIIAFAVALILYSRWLARRGILR